MSVIIRPYRRGGWEVDIRVVTPDGARQLARQGARAAGPRGGLRRLEQGAGGRLPLQPEGRGPYLRRRRAPLSRLATTAMEWHGVGFGG